MSTTVIYSNAGDPDTLALQRIWEGLEDVHVVEITPDSKYYELEVDNAIENEDDTLIFAGHGTSRGLLFPDFSKEEYILHFFNARLVHAKRVICVWCYASEFCKEHFINCFSTGMFISNINEAVDNCIIATDKEIQACEESFCTELNELIRSDIDINDWADVIYYRSTNWSALEGFNYGGLETF